MNPIIANHRRSCPLFVSVSESGDWRSSDRRQERGSIAPGAISIFLVEFAAATPGEMADRYFGLLEALEALFGRPIDLVMTAAIKNPDFLQGIQPSRTLLYAA